MIAGNAYLDRKDFTLFFHWMILRFKKILKVDYRPKTSSIRKKVDVVIPTVSKDFVLLKLVLTSLENLVQDINKIYIVAPEKEELLEFCKNNNCIFVNEKSVLGFGKDKITYLINGMDRSGWMFQQLLKLSGEKFTELEDYIVIDSDTVFSDKNSFYEDGKYIFFANEEWHKPYFESFKFFFGYNAPTRLSLTSHMMIFNHGYLIKLKNELEEKHGRTWYDVYISTLESGEPSCVSDYETYSNWVIYNYPERCKILPFYNKSVSRKYLENYDQVIRGFKGKLKSVSYHSYI